MRNAIALISLIVAFAVLVPGLLLPMIEVNGYLDKAEISQLGRAMLEGDSRISESMSKMVTGFIDNLDLNGQIEVYHKTRSILSTVRDLFDTGDWFVGFLILLFSVIVPFAKGIMLLVVLFTKQYGPRRRMLNISGAISKWSMADVFVVAVFVAYLAAKATQRAEDFLSLDATFGSGFYFFTAYCLFSLLSAALITIHRDGEKTPA